MQVEVATPSGTLRGLQRDGHQAFRGVRFAAPPTGERRFAAPAPGAPWDGVRDALEFGGSAPQPVTGGVLPVGPQDEDCLFLNVYTPAADGGRRPVMFFIHGGAFTMGSAAEATYDGGPLAVRGDVVVVTINYRLGALGFLYLGAHGGDEVGAVANAGMLDQAAALRWVRDNIAAFGGDPEQVTIFGESAGAFSVAVLMAMPAARGLFARAIAQSGQANRLGTVELATGTAQALLSHLGVADARALREQPARSIVDAQVAVASEVGRLNPLVDGRSLPHRPLDGVRAGQAATIPLLIGTNRDETNLYMNPKQPEIDDATLERRVARVLPRKAHGRAGEVIAIYRASRKSRGLAHGNKQILEALNTASRFRIPAIRLAEAQAAHQPRTFVYRFDWASPAWRGTMGAAHGLELPFVFGTLRPEMARMTGSGPEADALSARMMDAWIAFAKSGDPSCDAIGRWPGYRPETRATMVFDAHTRVEHAPFEEERAIWETLL